MGISRFYSFLFANYPKAHVQCDKKEKFLHNVDVLAIDMNNILHMCAQQVFEYGNYAYSRRFLQKKNPSKYDYFRRICATIDSLVEYVKPSKKLILCIDGVGSMAKLKQQRVRRYKCLLDFKDSESAQTFRKNCKFNPNEISPGTTLMDEISKCINSHIHMSMSSNPLWENLSVIFSNEKVPGEGEHKIFTLMRQEAKEHKHSYCIYGIDADLIMLSILNLNYAKTIHLLRENVFNENFICIDIENVRDSIISEFTPYYKHGNIDPMNLLYDFILIFFFFGNDFVPEIPSVDIEFNYYILNEYKTILSKYGYITKKDNNNLTLNTNNFKEFIFACSLIEPDILSQKNTELFFPSTILHQSIEKDSIVNMLKFNKVYNEIKLNNECKNACADYITTCIWILNYYVGNQIDFNWKYKYYYAPTFTSLFYHFDSYQTPKFNMSNPIFPFLQLLFIIPHHDRHILPEYLHDLVPQIDSKSIIIDFTMKRSDREAVIVIPEIDETNISREFYKRKYMTKNEDRNLIGKNIYYSRSNSSFYRNNAHWKDSFKPKINTTFKA